MKSPHIRLKALALAMLFTIVIAGIAYFVVKSLNEWRDSVVETNKVLTKVVVEQLHKSSIIVMDSLSRNSFFSANYYSKEEKDKLDNRLKIISTEIFSTIDGMEGGVYLEKYDEFLGYSYPTSPPPVPAYGPPPRSYEIIKTQILESIIQKKQIIKLHQFDPAVFPLATEPLIVNGYVVGAVWTRIHIERELPVLKLKEVFNIAAAVAILGLIIAVVVSIRLRKRIDNIRSGLEELQKNPSYKFKKLPGVFGFIGLSINKMVEAQTKDHNRSRQLEKELHQQDKMAVLGKLIAGVAHEVKTPLAIIKTRIQIWQQALKSPVNNKEAVSEDSMKLVVNEIDRLSKLVKRLLIFSKPISNKLQEIDINSLIEKTVELIKVEKNHDDINFDIAFERNLPTVLGDTNGMEQVFLNLLMNSVESISRDGRIYIETAYRSDEYMTQIIISDNGKGISEGIRNQIFDPFFTTKESGTGLGLSIAQEIVKAHKGRIEFSNENDWTICKIFLPTNDFQQGS